MSNGNMVGEAYELFLFVVLMGPKGNVLEVFEKRGRRVFSLDCII